MKEFKVTNVLLSDLLEGKSKYVEDSYLVFNRLIVKTTAHMITIKFLHDHELLMTMEEENYSLDPTIDFGLTDGRMKIEFKINA